MVLVFWVYRGRPTAARSPSPPVQARGQVLTLSHGGERGYPSPAHPDSFVSDQEWVT